mmetsp:Transcript_48808/g.115197  ORF Transcript_48808/g.115197 Transcript_48808/m.115197 type:complete len:326 (+) Transcript_48808:916-1893(+)
MLWERTRASPPPIASSRRSARSWLGRAAAWCMVAALLTVLLLLLELEVVLLAGEVEPRLVKRGISRAWPGMRRFPGCSWSSWSTSSVMPVRDRAPSSLAVSAGRSSLTRASRVRAYGSQLAKCFAVAHPPSSDNLGDPTTSKILASWSALKFSCSTDLHLQPVPGSPRKGGLPIIISRITAPAPHESTRALMVSLPISSSGARYHSVMSSRSTSMVLEPWIARPKSVSTAVPFLSISTFPDFTSMWSTPAAWMWATPARMSLAHVWMSASGTCRPARRARRTTWERSDLASSMTRTVPFSAEPSTCTTFGCRPMRSATLTSWRTA